MYPAGTCMAVSSRLPYRLAFFSHYQGNRVKENPPGVGLTMGGPATYRIIVHGTLDHSWARRLSGMSISERVSDAGETETILVGRLPDQAALSSVLNVLYELHLPVVSADCLESG